MAATASAASVAGAQPPDPAKAATDDKDDKAASVKPDTPKAEAKAEAEPEAQPPAPPPPQAPPQSTGFSFGSYGRMIAAGDLHGAPGRDANIVAHGSRLDEGNYVELELRRDDYWNVTKTGTRLVATLAVADPVFHYTGNFNIQMAVRNLYMETRGVGGSGLSIWAGSRMYRGDDIYLLDFWPLDNLNTVGGGVRYDFTPNTYLAAHYGLMQPSSDFFLQSVSEPQPFNNPGAANVLVLNRQELIGSLKFSHIWRVGDTGGIKAVVHSELHQLPAGQYQLNTPGVFEGMPSNLGFVIGGQLGAFTGKRDTHLNLFVRYATGLAAYGDFTTPSQLGPDKTTSGAHELVVALGGNYEVGPFGLMLGAYVRSFRNAATTLNFEDVDEGIVALRPHFFIGELGGIALEGSYQVQQRGVIDPISGSGPFTPHLYRFGVIPFISPGGRGDYSRPQFRVTYLVTSRSDSAKLLYPTYDVFSLRSIEQFLGFGVEWWFNSTSYGG
jgi:maltoporin